MDQCFWQCITLVKMQLLTVCVAVCNDALPCLMVMLYVQAAFVLPRKLLTEAARYFVQAPRGQSAAPGVSLLDRIEANCRRNVQLPRQLRDWDQFAFLQPR